MTKIFALVSILSFFCLGSKILSQQIKITLVQLSKRFAVLKSILLSLYLHAQNVLFQNL